MKTLQEVERAVKESELYPCKDCGRSFKSSTDFTEHFSRDKNLNITGCRTARG
jgi:hypothetical protein